jgi:prolyl-tRNA synthetase
MRMTQLLGRRDKDAPKEAQTISHQYLLRGGYARQVGSGLFSMLPLGLRVIRKIEAIIRDEMNRAGGQEVLMPVVLPRELWEESGRYATVGSELLRFKDRGGKDFVLGMTHEEAVVHLARNEAFSYKQYPFMVYQIQTKFRDEPRCRGGLIRVREFTMKDAYSFHESDECLKQTYAQLHQSYENVFRRAGLVNFISVASDAGMMGGGVSHEFMSITPIGEDSFLTCAACGYKANREVARTVYPKFEDAISAIEEVSTPETQSIEDVSQLLNVPATSTCKAFFCVDAKNNLVCAILRGDLEVNEAKIKTLLGTKELIMANDEQIRAKGMEPGYSSPLNTDTSKYRLVVDDSLRGRANLIAGANKKDWHVKGFEVARDLEAKGLVFEWVDIASVTDGAACPECQASMALQRGVEIGNIFQLGRKYSQSMGMTYLDKNGKAQVPIMGCYGIGVGRLMACLMEEHHDDYGPIWPQSVAPFELQINALDLDRGEGEVRKVSEQLYSECLAKGIDVVFDDRGEKAGFQFSDADLLGVPHRVVISPKTLKDGEVEYRTRAVKDSVRLNVDNLLDTLYLKVSAGRG